VIERQKSGLYDSTDRIWRLLNLQIWGDMFITGKRERRWDGLMMPGAAAV
jgi:asparagine synthase (glutamine-hydrolysing)